MSLSLISSCHSVYAFVTTTYTYWVRGRINDVACRRGVHTAGRDRLTRWIKRQIMAWLWKQGYESFKVIENDIIRKLGYGFLFAFHSTWLYLKNFRDGVTLGDILVENPDFLSYPTAIDASVRGGPHNVMFMQRNFIITAHTQIQSINYNKSIKKMRDWSSTLRRLVTLAFKRRI